MAHDVFLSYAHPDKAIADAICARLEARGIRCWYAPRDVLPGEAWSGAIVSGIDQARVLVLVYSSSANSSGQVLNEVERAVSKNLVVVPFRIEDIPPSKDLEYFMSSRHWLDALGPPMEEHIEALVRSVARLLDRDVESRPRTRRPPSSRSRRSFAVVVALLLAAAIGGFLLLGRDGGRKESADREAGAVRATTDSARREEPAEAAEATEAEEAHASEEPDEPEAPVEPAEPNAAPPARETAATYRMNLEELDQGLPRGLKASPDVACDNQGLIPTPTAGAPSFVRTPGLDMAGDFGVEVEVSGQRVFLVARLEAADGKGDVEFTMDALAGRWRARLGAAPFRGGGKYRRGQALRVRLEHGDGVCTAFVDGQRADTLRVGPDREFRAVRLEFLRHSSRLRVSALGIAPLPVEEAAEEPPPVRPGPRPLPYEMSPKRLDQGLPRGMSASPDVVCDDQGLVPRLTGDAPSFVRTPGLDMAGDFGVEMEVSGQRVFLVARLEAADGKGDVEFTMDALAGRWKARLGAAPVRGEGKYRRGQALRVRLEHGDGVCTAFVDGQRADTLRVGPDREFRAVRLEFVRHSSRLRVSALRVEPR